MERDIKAIVDTPSSLEGGTQEKLEYIKSMIEVARDDKKHNMLYISLSVGVIALLVSQINSGAGSALPLWARTAAFLCLLCEAAGAACLFVYIRHLHIVQMRMTRCMPSVDVHRVRELWAGDFGVWQTHKAKYRLGLSLIAIGMALLAMVLFETIVLSGVPEPGDRVYDRMKATWHEAAVMELL